MMLPVFPSINDDIPMHTAHINIGLESGLRCNFIIAPTITRLGMIDIVRTVVTVNKDDIWTAKKTALKMVIPMYAFVENFTTEETR